MYHGAKGLGEHALHCVVPALANARTMQQAFYNSFANNPLRGF